MIQPAELVAAEAGIKMAMDILGDRFG